MVSVKERMERAIEELVEHGVRLNEAVRDFEKKYIAAAVRQAKGNRCDAAKLLGVHRNTLGKKMNGNGNGAAPPKITRRRRKKR